MFFAAHEARTHPLSLSNEVHHMFHPMRTSENNYTHWRKKCQAWNKTFCGLTSAIHKIFFVAFIWVYVRPISLSPRAKAEPITASICQPGLFVLVSFSDWAWWDHQPRCCASVSRVNASIAERPVLYHLTLFPANFSQAQSYSTCIRHSLSHKRTRKHTHFAQTSFKLQIKAIVLHMTVQNPLSRSLTPFICISGSKVQLEISRLHLHQFIWTLCITFLCEFSKNNSCQHWDIFWIAYK